MNNYSKGMLVKVQVTGIEKYGIFVSVDDTYSGLIHISEISDGFVKNVSDYVSIGETIFAKVIDIDEENNKLKLSIKNTEYKVKKKFPKIIQTKLGFQPLKEKLVEWISMYNKNNK